ncbi:hypothetical protein VTK56DRAFT_3351 [Thermocarpiscus australiensis]
MRPQPEQTRQAQSQSQPHSTPTLPPPILTLPKCLIRPHHPSDAPALQRAGDSPNVARYMSTRFPQPYTLSDAHAWIDFATKTTVAPADRGGNNNNNNTLLCYAICDPETNTVQGGIGLKTRDDVEAHTLEVGYWLGEDRWGRGTMTEALQAFVGWTFERFPAVRRLEAGVFGGNEASARVLAKAGFVLEGRRRKAAEKNGEVFDILVFGLLREEWNQESWGRLGGTR